MIFKLGKKPLIEDNPELISFDSFNNCSDQELRFIFLVYDYESPLRKLPMDRKKDKAADTVKLPRTKNGALSKTSKSVVEGTNPRVKEAIKDFMELQYDREKDLSIAIDEQIDEFISLFKKKGKTDTELKISVGIMKQLPSIMKDRQDIYKVLISRPEYSVEEEEEEISEDDLSTLDIFNMEEDDNELYN